MSIIPISIRSGKSSMTQFRTFCCYGDTRVGKTRFAGTFPNALFISDASERGWTTLETMPEGDYYHPGQGPTILPVADQAGMISALALAEQWVKLGFIDSVVIDSLTFYAESWYQHELSKMLAAPGAKGTDTRALYGALANHLSNTRVQIHRWPCHVAWLALAAPPDNDQIGGPMLSGKSRQRFPAGCDHIFYHRKYEAVGDDGQPTTVFEVRTQAFERYIGGGRDGGALPDPIPWPTFRVVADYMGLPEFPPKTVPEDLLAAAAAGPPAVATPPAARAASNGKPAVARPAAATRPTISPRAR